MHVMKRGTGLLAAAVLGVALLAGVLRLAAGASAVSAVGPRDTVIQTVTLAPSQDNTLYATDLGNISNGLGQYLFAGNTNNGDARRAVVAFDLSAIPTNATVLTASLSLTMSRSITGETAVSLHSLQQAWGEGDSAAVGEEGGGAAAEPGDATWLYAFFNTTSWTTPGGDFDAIALAATPVAESGRYDWTSAELLADVQAKVASPAGNFGWLLLGDESGNGTAKRFDSVQNDVVENRPSLTVMYEAEAVATFTAYAPLVIAP